MFKILHFFALILFVGLCTSCEQKQRNSSLENIPKPSKQVVMDGLKRPWSMAFLNENEALVTEKDGNLLKVNLSTGSKKIIEGFPSDLADTLTIDTKIHKLGAFPANVKDGYRARWNQGIFDIVVHPNYSDNQWIYVSYVSQKEGLFTTKVIRSKVVNDVLTAHEDILVAQPYYSGLFHFGGGLTFGQDGKLYITVGERLYSEIAEPEIPIAQNLSDGRGKIYRLNTDGSIPDDNPDFGENSVPGIYASGIRAAQGLTLHPKNGNIYFTEHGTIQGDELNILEAGSNYGWPLVTTGKFRSEEYFPPSAEDKVLKDPIWSWYKTIAPTGLTFYTGEEFPQWKDKLIVPGLSKGNFWVIELQGEEIISVEEVFINERHRTRKAVLSPEGKLYILTDEVDGKIIRILPAE